MNAGGPRSPPESPCVKSTGPGPKAGPDIGKKIVHVTAAGTGGQVVDHVAKVRPRIESVPGRAGADAQEYRGRLQPAVAAHVQPIGPADGQRPDGPLGAPLSMANRASSRYRTNVAHWFRAYPTACPNRLFGVADRC